MHSTDDAHCAVVQRGVIDHHRDLRDRDGSAATDNDPERVVAEPVGRRLEHVWHPASHQRGIVTMASV